MGDQPLTALLSHGDEGSTIRDESMNTDMCQKFHGGGNVSHRLLEESVSYLVLLKSKTFPTLGFTRIWEVSRQSKGSTITRFQAQKLIYSYTFSQLPTKDGTLVSEHLNY